MVRVSVASCVGLASTCVSEPDAGTLHVRFDEGEQRSLLPTLLLYVTPVPRRSGKTDCEDCNGNDRLAVGRRRGHVARYTAASMIGIRHSAFGIGVAQPSVASCANAS